MFITYNKVASLGSKKLDLFKRMLQKAIAPGDEMTVDDIIKKYTTEEEHYIMAKLSGNSLAGVVVYRLDGTNGQIDYIAVAKKYLKNGHGRQLINYVFDQNSVNRITLESDIKSATFFEKVGFKVTEQFLDHHKNKRFRFEKKVDKQVYF